MVELNITELRELSELCERKTSYCFARLVQSVKEFSLEVLVSKTKFGDVVQDCRPVLCCVCIASVKWPTQVAVGMAFSPKMMHDSHDTCCVVDFIASTPLCQQFETWSVPHVSACRFIRFLVWNQKTNLDICVVANAISAKLGRNIRLSTGSALLIETCHLLSHLSFSLWWPERSLGSSAPEIKNFSLSTVEYADFVQHNSKLPTATFDHPHSLAQSILVLRRD